VRSEKLGEVAREFDVVHSVRRAQEVGSVHRIVAADGLRPTSSTRSSGRMRRELGAEGSIAGKT